MQTHPHKVGKVWIRPLSVRPERFEEWKSWLTAEETERATHGVRPEIGQSFVTGRGWLRELLSQETSLPPAQIVFHKTRLGKLKLAMQAPGGPAPIPGFEDLEFSLSHSGAWLALACIEGRRIGIDIEQVRPRKKAKQVAQAFLHPGEVAQLETLPPREWLDGFYCCWTRKEAFTKALGLGLQYDFRQFEVTATPGSHPGLLSSPDGQHTGWTLYDIPVEAGYYASLAIAGEPIEIVIDRMQRMN